MQTDIYADAQVLVRILRNGTALKKDKPLIRAIGERLNQEGGWDKMQAVSHVIRSQFPHGEGGEDGWHPGTIDAIWNGIGEWVW